MAVAVAGPRDLAQGSMRDQAPAATASASAGCSPEPSTLLHAGLPLARAGQRAGADLGRAGRLQSAGA